MFKKFSRNHRKSATIPAYPSSSGRWGRLLPRAAWQRYINLVFGAVFVGIPLGMLAGWILVLTLYPITPASLRIASAAVRAPEAVISNQVSTPVPVHWSGPSRANILVLGTDQREGEQFAARTDSMIVASIDLENKVAGMLSLPRDLWVPIPGVGKDRINVAYRIGGAALARQTVEKFLGVPIDHHVVIGFRGFQQIVDLVGGIVIDVERPIKDDRYPDNNHGVQRIFFQPGLQRMDGEVALRYARTRHADSDYHRARRQQRVALALKQAGLRPQVLHKAPQLFNILSQHIKTDLGFREALSLALVAKDIGTSKIVHRVIDEEVTTPRTVKGGAQVEVPDPILVRALVQEVFAHPHPVPLQVRLEIQNAARREGLARRTSSWLQTQGILVTQVASAPASKSFTELIDYSGMVHARRVIAERLSIGPDRIRIERGLGRDVDIRVILGRDFKLPGK